MDLQSVLKLLRFFLWKCKEEERKEIFTDSQKETVREKGVPRELQFWSSCSVRLEQPWEAGREVLGELKCGDEHPKPREAGWDIPSSIEPADR